MWKGEGPINDRCRQGKAQEMTDADKGRPKITCVNRGRPKELEVLTSVGLKKYRCGQVKFQGV